MQVGPYAVDKDFEMLLNKNGMKWEQNENEMRLKKKCFAKNQNSFSHLLRCNTFYCGYLSKIGYRKGGDRSKREEKE